MLQRIFDSAAEYPSLRFALTHPSSATCAEERHQFQRLELLGDAVLGLVATEMLLNAFPKLDEGEITVRRAQLVSEKPLAAWAQEVNLGNHVRIATQKTQKDHTLADAVEAIIGAVYSDKGLATAEELIRDIICDKLTTLTSMRPEDWDAKGAFQRLAWKKLKGKPIAYEVLATSGAAHDPKFEVSLKVDGKEFGRGIASTKKEAEKIAASQGFQILKAMAVGIDGSIESSVATDAVSNEAIEEMESHLNGMPPAKRIHVQESEKAGSEVSGQPLRSTTPPVALAMHRRGKQAQTKGLPSNGAGTATQASFATPALSANSQTSLAAADDAESTRSNHLTNDSTSLPSLTKEKGPVALVLTRRRKSLDEKDARTNKSSHVATAPAPDRQDVSNGNLTSEALNTSNRNIISTESATNVTKVEQKPLLALATRLGKPSSSAPPSIFAAASRVRRESRTQDKASST